MKTATVTYKIGTFYEGTFCGTRFAFMCVSIEPVQFMVNGTARRFTLGETDLIIGKALT